MGVYCLADVRLFAYRGDLFDAMAICVQIILPYKVEYELNFGLLQLRI